MKIQTKKEIEFSVEEIEQILIEYLDKEYRLNGNTHFIFKIANKMIPGPDPHDGYDHHVFDGVKVVVQT
jgi:hypothetical protein